MNILYTCDNNYLWLMGISVTSLFDNNQKTENIDVYLLGHNISKENKALLKQIEKNYNRKIIVIDVPFLDIPSVLISERWPLSAFYRLYCGSLLPNNIEKILYLDCDTIIADNIGTIESVDMEDNIFCGVKDCIGKKHKENIGLAPDELYINGGVILINISKLREIDITNEVEFYMYKFKNHIQYADQDILNGVFSGKIGLLKAQYDVMTIEAVHTYKEILILRNPTNYYSEDEINKALKNPLIIHYTTNMRIVKPWYKDSDHPFKELFEKYKEISPWKDKQLLNAKFYGMSSKVVCLLLKLPNIISYRILGLIHSILKPYYVKVKR